MLAHAVQHGQRVKHECQGFRAPGDILYLLRIPC